MNETGVYDFKLEYTFVRSDYMAELDRQLALLLSTRGHHAGSGVRPEHGLCGYAAEWLKEPIHGGGHGKGGKVYPTVRVRNKMGAAENKEI